MRRLLIAFALFLIFTIPGNAWQIPKTNAPAFIGSCDLVSLTVFYGVRACSGAYAIAHGNAFDLRRSSDNATMTATFLSSGDLDTVTIAAWAGADTIFISKAYDQTGGGRDVSAAAASQPELLLSGGANSKPYISSPSGGGRSLVSGSAYTPSSTVVSFTSVTNRISGSLTAFILIENGANNGLYVGGANQIAEAGGASGSIFATASDGTWHSSQSLVNAASSSITVDGTTTTGSTTGNTTGGFIQAFVSGSNSIKYEELGFIDGTAWSSAQNAALRANQQAYYVTP